MEDDKYEAKVLEAYRMSLRWSRAYLLVKTLILMIWRILRTMIRWNGFYSTIFLEEI